MGSLWKEYFRITNLLILIHLSIDGLTGTFFTAGFKSQVTVQAWKELLRGLMENHNTKYDYIFDFINLLSIFIRTFDVLVIDNFENKMLYISIIMLNKITIHESVEGLMKLLIWHGSACELRPFIRIYEHFIIS